MGLYELDGVVIDDGDARRVGHRISWCPKREVMFYLDDGSPTPEYGGEERPCPECGLMATREGHDACLGTIPRAKAACCGHGVREGYVLFLDGHREASEPWSRARRSVAILGEEEARSSSRHGGVTGGPETDGGARA